MKTLEIKNNKRINKMYQNTIIKLKSILYIFILINCKHLHYWINPLSLLMFSFGVSVTKKYKI